jgi:hypothetical protein
MHCNMIGNAEKERPPCGGPSSNFCFAVFQATACAFRFLRQPSCTNAGVIDLLLGAKR